MFTELTITVGSVAKHLNRLVGLGLISLQVKGLSSNEDFWLGWVESGREGGGENMWW